MDGRGINRQEIFLRYSPGSVQTLSGLPDGPHLSILRLDQINAWASGNKYFKLRHILHNAIQEGHHHIVSKGGMFSNHLAALAEACHAFDFTCTAIVRSYQPDEMNPTIQYIRSNGAEISYLPPSAYKAYTAEMASVQFPGCVFIPEGGLSESGILGASEIISACLPWQPTHVVVPGGTLATFAGLLSSAPAGMQVIAVPAWRGCTQAYVDDLLKRFQISPACQWEIWPDFHFGGFGRTTEVLLEFMQQFETQTGVPLDPVYTAKMMYAVDQKIKEKVLPPEARILAIHTGGLQGRMGLEYLMTQGK